MSTATHNYSEYDKNEFLDVSGKKVGIVVSEWNINITTNLLNGAKETLIEAGVDAKNIVVKWVPGSFELVYGASKMLNENKYDSIIVLGSVIKGETPHFDYVCSGVTQGISNLNEKGEIPVIFGLLTDNNVQQAEDRSGGKLGNKGTGCAVAAIKMMTF